MDVAGPVAPPDWGAGAPGVVSAPAASTRVVTTCVCRPCGARRASSLVLPRPRIWAATVREGPVGGLPDHRADSEAKESALYPRSHRYPTRQASEVTLVPALRETFDNSRRRRPG